MIGFVSGIIVVLGSLLVERVGIDDPVGAMAAHGMSGVWGTLSLGLFAVPALAKNLQTGQGGLFYGGGLHQMGTQVIGLAAVGAFTFTLSFLVLFLFKVTVGIRTHSEDEQLGLDVSEHGMWGYPEFYIPVPGGYGSEQNIQIGQQYSNHEVIVTEGSEGDSMYVVQSGKVEVVKTADDGSEHQPGHAQDRRVLRGDGDLRGRDPLGHGAGGRRRSRSRGRQEDGREAAAGQPASRRQHAEDDVLTAPGGERRADGDPRRGNGLNVPPSPAAGHGRPPGTPRASRARR